MPATNGTPSNGRFELPKLTPINYSLTDGTGIPPPPDSPIEESVPAAASASENTTATTNGQSSTATNGNGAAYEGRGRTTTNADEQPPMSPASSTRQGSIRRFLSRKSLNTNYTNGTNTNASQEDLAARPESAMSFASQRPSLAKKKSGSWFKRLGSSNGSKRTSIIYEDKKPGASAPAMPVKKGPPPPKLPELNQLKAKIADDDEGSLGAEDMFKDIK
ncbi:hypothetical protein BKA65DRAFT_158428 [Rhexocercosporidium sp. MPI-PUGE-AT-0058]|nr:hypothetical protein BKA65DRAFT_158428 [Rhexocercosporidium sp. MPI-PUGE-AT-0058]